MGKTAHYLTHLHPFLSALEAGCDPAEFKLVGDIDRRGAWRPPLCQSIALDEALVHTDEQLNATRQWSRINDNKTWLFMHSGVLLIHL
jgi:hypothetical protein